MEKSIKYVLCCFFLFIFCFSNAQETKKTESNGIIDSLLNVIKTLSSPSPEIKLVEGVDTVLINTLNLLSRKYINTGNYAQAMQYSKQAELLADKFDYKRGLAFSYSNTGVIYIYRGNYEKAASFILKSLSIREKSGDKKGIADSYNTLGNIYDAEGNFDKALDNHIKSLKLKKVIGDKNGGCFL